MKHPFRCRILPSFTMGAGGLGLALRLWLFSATDEKGLLPTEHIADAALYILMAVTLGILFLATRELTSGRAGSRFSPLAVTVSHAVGGLGLLVCGLLTFTAGTVRLAEVAAAAAVAGCIALFCMAFLHGHRKPIPYWLCVILTIALMLDTVAQCQLWGSQSQLQEYGFPLLASVFLILSAYQATALAAGKGNPRLLAFFSQSALFLCCLSLNTAHWPMYFGMLFWAAAQLDFCISHKKEA